MHQVPLMVAEEDIVGLDVSDGIVSVARVGIRQDGVLRLRNAGWTECPAGATQRELAAAIRPFVRPRVYELVYGEPKPSVRATASISSVLRLNFAVSA